MKVKITTTHDWVRIAVSTEDKKKISLTVNRNGASCSGTISADLAKKAIGDFDRLMNKKGETIAIKMDKLRVHAENSKDIETYVNGISSI